MKHTIFCLLTLLFICDSVQADATENSIHAIAIKFFKPLPNKMPGGENDNDDKIALGKRLYFDNQLSINNTQSCNSCHNLLGTDENPGSGTDNLAVSFGALGSAGTRNSPTTWNAGLQFTQFWDGRANTLIEQAKFPILNPVEMALPSKEEAITRLTNTGYLALFIKAYPDEASPLNFHNILDALAAFQRTLISEDRFDLFLNGETNALSEKEKQGVMTFITAGCVACHNGPLLGGQMFTKMGVVNPYPNKIDRGRAHLTMSSADDFQFKVPSLRNVSKTAPYFHDGAETSLEQAVKDTGFHQLGITLSNKEVEDITSFLKALDNIKVVTR
ncbi:cytochrome-c peroxidase [Shewanella woodyi]|uniref:cytochrome-c peroxidase n=1 Tax=Shewanella woodyi TaxID=60961 RepID=UPI0007F90A64|nr:cytochrome c peroxidase [Shewanella woodyi]